MTTPQPSRQARFSGRSLSILMQLASLTTVWWANVPSAPIARLMSSPLASWWRDVPSDSCMPVAVMLFMSHRLECPRAQLGQRPQAGTKPNTTWSPGATENTPAPTSMTTPAPSCPPIVGSGAVAPSRSPVRRCSSLWHMPEACDLDQHLPRLRRIELDLLDAPRRVELAEDGGLGLHRKPPVGMFRRRRATLPVRTAADGQIGGPAHDLDVRSRAVRRRRGAALGRRGSSRRTAGGRRAACRRGSRGG